MRSPRITAILLASALTGCTTLKPHDFARSQTRFELDQFLLGHTRSWGVFEQPSGQPEVYFNCDAFGRRGADGELLFHQRFVYSDGKSQLRDWQIKRIDAQHWRATMTDMVGEAIGESEGNAFYWEYDVSLNRKNPLATVHIRQWFYQPEGTDTMLVRLVATKLGIPVTQMTESIHRVP